MEAPAWPPANSAPPVPPLTAPSYGTPTSPIPGYGQSSPAPTPLPGYGQVPTTNYAQTPPAPFSVPPATDYPPVPYSGTPLTPVSWATRVIGGLVDWLPIAVMGFLGWVFIGRIPALAYLFEAIGLLWGIFNTGYLGGKTGVSFGRRVAGTKLVREDTGQPIGAGLGIGRYILHAIDSAICCVGFLFPLWTQKKQTIADMIVKTIVIENK